MFELAVKVFGGAKLAKEEKVSAVVDFILAASPFEFCQMHFHFPFDKMSGLISVSRVDINHFHFLFFTKCPS